MDRMILFFSSFISCVVVVGITFQFWSDRYEKTYCSKYLYIILAAINVLIVTITNLWMLPAVNMIANAVCVGAIVYCFYDDLMLKSFIRIFESEAFLVVMGVVEAMGVYMLDIILELFDIVPQSPEILQGIENAFSKIIVLFSYYVIFNKLWKKSAIRTPMQYILYLIMFIYGIASVLATAMISSEEHPVVLMLVIACTVFANLYLLYFMKCMDERNYYKLQFEMMKQQENMQYDNYKMQQDRYEKSLSILHDVKKHIMVIEGLYNEDKKKEAIIYTKQINDMLLPLVPKYYVENPIMNCLLSEKIREAEKSGIIFKVEILTGEVGFMRPVDITTLFGNLLDNAIAASKNCNNRKCIGFYMKSYNEMLFIKLENSISKPISVKNGKITNVKRGIGTLNIQRCVDAYEGSLIYKIKNEMLECHILLNMTNGL